MTRDAKSRLIAAIAMPLFLLHHAPANARPLPAATAAATPATVQMDHISIQSIGTGSPVVLIPGLSSPRAVWDGVAPSLAARHRVILVQVNGFAGDDPRANLQPGLLDGVMADLHAYLTREKVGSAAVVGHSMGGLVGLMLAKAHAGDVGRLMVVDALPFIGDLFLPGATVAMVEPQARTMRDQLAGAYGKPANPAVAAQTAATMALKPGSRTAVAGWVAQADPRVTAAALYEDMTTDLRPDLPAIATPITLVFPYGSDAQRTQVEQLYRNVYAKAPHVSFVPVADSAHFVMLDQPAAFATALTAFLAG